MANCPNCKARITCGCQRRTATNGAAVCTKCKSGYERTITVQKNEEARRIRKESATAAPNTAPLNVRAQFIPNIKK